MHTTIARDWPAATSGQPKGVDWATFAWNNSPPSGSRKHWLAAAD